ncbi:MAG: hypothetical protein HKN45_01195, partial [Flavobacteriales bacterium]|nr:hypothetical protein [Flavobacteriales bacterium]
ELGQEVPERYPESAQRSTGLPNSVGSLNQSPVGNISRVLNKRGAALDILPSGEWFREPIELGNPVDLCALSGYLSGTSCPNSIQIDLPSQDYSELGSCQFHRSLYVNEDESLRGSRGCAGDMRLTPAPWFVLPPVEEWYYKTKNPDYRPLPPLIEGCQLDGKQMDFIYPNPFQIIYIPKDLDGRHSKVICRLVHREEDMEVYWYLDEKYLGATQGIHDMPIYASYGQHKLSVIDKNGVEAQLSFETLSKDQQ